MTTNKPEVVAWRWFKPTVNEHGETVGGIWKLDGAPAFLPWWTNEPLVRLSDYERLQDKCGVLVKDLELLLRRLEKMPRKLWLKEQIETILTTLAFEDEKSCQHSCVGVQKQD